MKNSKLTEAAAALNAGHPTGLAAGGKLPPLFFFTDEARTPDPLAAIPALPEGCGVVFRHYGIAARAELATMVARACAAEGRLCLVAGDAALASAVGADGVHLPEGMLRKLTERPRAGIVTAAAHGLDAIRIAESLGADAVFLSPVFATQSHAENNSGRTPLGIETFARLTAATALPVYALGGVTNENAMLFEGSGAAGIAAIGALL